MLTLNGMQLFRIAMFVYLQCFVVCAPPEIVRVECIFPFFLMITQGDESSLFVGISRGVQGRQEYDIIATVHQISFVESQE